MAISITRLSGGNTPADGSDPRTFPAIWNASATALEGVASDLDDVETEIGDYDLPSLNGVSIISPTTDEVLYYNGTSWANGHPTGSIIQVVSTVKDDTFSASVGAGNSSAVTGLSASITPSSTSSKILLFVTCHTAQSAAFRPSFILKRDSTIIGVGATSSSRSSVTSTGHNHDGDALSPLNITFLDSPSSTSSISYSVEASNTSTVTQTLYVNRTIADADNSSVPRSVSTITLMEVAG